MCEANAYLIVNGKENLIMESVDLVEPIGKNKWTLVSMFGERKTITGRIKNMELVDHRVVFEAPIRRTYFGLRKRGAEHGKRGSAAGDQ